MVGRSPRFLGSDRGRGSVSRNDRDGRTVRTARRRGRKLATTNDRTARCVQGRRKQPNLFGESAQDHCGRASILRRECGQRSLAQRARGRSTAEHVPAEIASKPLALPSDIESFGRSGESSPDLELYSTDFGT